MLDGTAEAIPLPDASVDVVTVAQAFHWFRFDEALAEIRRVLRPGGGLAILFNERDERDAVGASSGTTVIEWHARRIAQYQAHRLVGACSPAPASATSARPTSSGTSR